MEALGLLQVRFPVKGTHFGCTLDQLWALRAEAFPAEPSHLANGMPLLHTVAHPSRGQHLI